MTQIWNHKNLSSALCFDLLNKTNNENFFIFSSKNSELRNLKKQFEFFGEKNIYTLPEFKISSFESGQIAQFRKKRISFLYQFFNSQKQNKRKIYLIHNTALFLPSGNKEFWVNSVFHLKLEQKISSKEITDYLIDNGYQQKATTEKVFDFSFRGGIIDIFCPLFNSPIRINLFENKVNSIHFFSNKSQRSIGESLKEISICPSFEFKIDDHSFDLAYKNIKNEIKTREWLPEDKDNFYHKVKQGFHFKYIDFWKFYFSPKTPQVECDFHKHLETIKSKKIIFLEQELCINKAKYRFEEIQEDYETYLNDDEALPPFNNIFNINLKERSQNLNADFDYQLKADVAPLNHDEIFLHLENNEISKSESPFKDKVVKLLNFLKNKEAKACLVFNTGSQLERFQFLLDPYSIPYKKIQSIDNISNSGLHLLYSEQELLHPFYHNEFKILFLKEEFFTGIKKTNKKSNSNQDSVQSLIDTISFSQFQNLKKGDLIIHRDYGLGCYQGTREYIYNNIPNEFIEIEYKDQDKILLPLTKLNLIQPYGQNSAEIALDKIGKNTSWDKKVKKAKKDILILARELISLYSARALAKAPAISLDQKLYEEFSLSFPYNETKDQLKCIEIILEELENHKPMDRLICGDVGYGKTEVAMRGLFKVIKGGFQGAILAPTTLLATQHFNTFSSRFNQFGINVALISRFQTAKENKLSLEKLKEGKLHLIIGTHRLLSDDVQFKNLGLLVVDEEQRFGVHHKEKIKKLKTNVHVLTLTATPIPRTLNLALSGMRDISIMTTPPQDRLSVKTSIKKRSKKLIKSTIEQELKRGGQIYFLHNKVKTIEIIKEELLELIPTLKLHVVHGQMDEKILESRMLDFYKGKVDLLLTTTIIESGLDVSNANSLIVDRADRFGLSQLYQIRGRVGRSSRKAYSLMLLPKHTKITKEARERLDVLETYQDLGSGFHIASRDLDIRGSGNLLGKEQSGQMHAIGFENYVHILNEAIAEVKGETLIKEFEPEMKLPIAMLIPQDYIPDIGQRLVFYKKFSNLQSEQEIEEIEDELKDRFGRLPKEVKNLSLSMLLKNNLKKLEITHIISGAQGFTLNFSADSKLELHKIVEFAAKYPSQIQFLDSHKILMKNIHLDPNQPHKLVEKILSRLELIKSWVLS